MDSNSESSVAPAIPSDSYTAEYYTDCCQGYDEFNATSGQVLPRRLQIPLGIVAPEPGMKILDIGSGRGELPLHLARRGAAVWGIDYAAAALDLAAALMATPAAHDVSTQIRFARASALDLPFASTSFDAALMLDVVEHLSPAELDRALGEVMRVLKPGGRLIVHTMPSLWYYRWGYPTFRFMERLRGKRLPPDPRDRWQYKDVHINEQTPLSLRRTVRAAGFEARVWLETTQTYAHERSMLVRIMMETLTRAYPFRWIYCNDIFAVGVKP
jgi:ubiquinone/menaquinone biosynthesis C-methylase UbiE